MVFLFMWIVAVDDGLPSDKNASAVSFCPGTESNPDAVLQIMLRSQKTYK